MNKAGLRGFAAAAMIVAAAAGSNAVALAQQSATAARGVNPVLTGQPEPPPAVLTPAAPRARANGAGAQGGFNGPFAREAAKLVTVPPAPGVTPLAIDLFSSKNFYKDKASWMDPRYYRCNTPREMVEVIWESGRIGANPPTSASWGNCNIDFPRERIVSPYPYKTAKEQYTAMMAQAKAHGGPTVYTKATTPDWDGFYVRDPNGTDSPGFTGPDRRPGGPNRGERWHWGGINQASTLLSLLTPEYQKRYVQMLYHEAVDNSKQWSASFCLPEGLSRWWSAPSQASNFELSITPTRIEFLSGVADNFIREVLIGREHVQKVPQWFGETVGFWDGDTLVSWTANVQGWTQHTLFEFSDQFETVETYKPLYDAAHHFVGIDHEAIWYDPASLVQPVRVRDRFLRRALAGDKDARYTFIECLSNIRNVQGRPVQTTKGDPNFIDYYGRPWAQNWEEWFEKGWEKPADSLVPSDVLDVLK